MLIINACLTNPPSTVPCFRDLTLYAYCFLNVKVLLESIKEDVDLYYKWLKTKGAMDFVYDFVDPGTEEGIRVDIDFKFPGTVCVVDRITPETLPNIRQKVARFLIDY